MSSEHLSLAEIVGPWVDPEFESGLIDRMRNAWPKPIGSLTNHELATCLRQTIATEQVLPIAKKRVDENLHDESELDDDELAKAIEDLEYRLKCEREHRRIIDSRFDPDGPKKPNKAPEPTPRPVTIPAEPGIAPGRVVAHL